jgi:hypothetical protein
MTPERKEKIKEVVVHTAALGGFVWWMTGGHQMITDLPEYENFINQFSGGGFFSVGSVVIAVTVFAAMLYPPLAWYFLCLEILYPGIAKQALLDRELWLMPGTLVAFLVTITVMALVWSVYVHLVYIGVLIWGVAKVFQFFVNLILGLRALAEEIPMNFERGGCGKAIRVAAGCCIGVGDCAAKECGDPNS